MKKLLARLLLRLGYSIRRSPFADAGKVNLFLDREFEPTYRDNPFFFIDVGARGGIKPEWRHFEKHLRVLAFEADPEAYAELMRQKDPRILYSQTFLHNEKNTIDFHITRGGEQSSIYHTNRAFTDKFHHLPTERRDVLRTIQIQAGKLDDVLNELRISDVDFIKLDTEGSERLILEGAQNILKNSVLALEIEVEFAEVYRDQPRFADVDQFVRPLGFDLFDIRRCYWKRDTSAARGFKEQLVWGEALYLKRPELLPPVQAKYLKYVSLCMYYGYWGFAEEIVNAGLKSRVLTDRHREQILVALRSSSAAYFSAPASFDDERLGNAPWIR